MVLDQILLGTLMIMVRIYLTSASQIHLQQPSAKTRDMQRMKGIRESFFRSSTLSHHTSQELWTTRQVRLGTVATVKLVEQKLDGTVMVADKEIGKGIGLSTVQTTTSYLHSLINNKLKGFYHFMMFFFTFHFFLLLFYTTFQKSSLFFYSIV